MSVEQTPVKPETVRTSEELKVVSSALLKKGSPEWRSYVPHDTAAECKFRVLVVESRVLSLKQGPQQPEQGAI